MSVCPCSLIRELFKSPDEMITAVHAMKAAQRGYHECAKYIAHIVAYETAKTAREAFPECFESVPPTPPPTPPTPTPKFEIEKISVDKTTVKPGETVNVEIWIRNIGNRDGFATLRLTVDGVTKMQTNIYINANSVRIVRYNIHLDKVGTHTICAKV